MPAGFLPLARLGELIGQRDLARQGKHHGDGMFGRRDGIAVGGVHHHDAIRRRGFDIDVVDTDPGASDDFEVGSRRKDLGRHLGRRPYGQTVILADARDQLVRLHADFHIDLDAAVLENLNRLKAEIVGNKDFGHFILLWPKRVRP